MIEFKNNIYNSKENKLKRSFQKKMEIKKKFRLKTQKFIPLSNYEKYLYQDNNFGLKFNNIIKPDNDDFFILNKNIHLLSVISKENINNLYDDLYKLIKNNPAKNFMKSGVLEDDLKNSVYLYKNNYHAELYSNLKWISPNCKNLDKIVDHIKIFLFDLSNNYIGVSFTIELNDEFIKDLNSKITDDFENKSYYRQYLVGKKKKTTLVNINKNILRKNYIDNTLLEIKIRTYNFLKNYIDLYPLNNNSPISLNEYVTSTNYMKSTSNFLSSYDFYILSEKDIYHNLNIKYYSKTEGQKFDKTDFYFDFYTNYDVKNRSTRLLMNTKYPMDFITEESELIPLYICTLYYFLNDDFEEILGIKRKNLSESYNTNSKKIYKNFLEINKLVYQFQNLFIETSFYENYCDYITLNFEQIINQQKKRYEKNLSDNNNLNNEFSNYILVTSTKQSLTFSKVSIIIALLSLILTTIFSFLNFYESRTENKINLIIQEVNQTKE